VAVQMVEVVASSLLLLLPRLPVVDGEGAAQEAEADDDAAAASSPKAVAPGEVGAGPYVQLRSPFRSG
jgi:hypothetical protein